MNLSVVMSVYNGAATLDETLDSIAAQTVAEHEFIIVDDGSTDATPQILARRAAADARIRVITQPNAGLTRALIRGCAEARGTFIARQDCGDTSLPDRFAKQLAAFAPDVVLASCAARHVAPGGETLYETRANGDDVRASLLRDSVRDIRGLPAHPTAMFRRDAYEAAGGYRDAFRFAQDVDLWIRLAQRGRIVILGEVLYEARYELGSISFARRDQQIALSKIAIALRDGGSERLLDEARAISSAPRQPGKRNDAAALYFVASCLRRNGDMSYKRYARAALRSNPLHWRAWLLLMR